MDYDDIITIDPDKTGGRPCVQDRYAVQDVLNYRASCLTETDVLAHFPGLTAEDIRACLAFAANRIRKVKDITAENPNAEVWKYLRFLMDVPATAQMIRDHHRVPADTQTKNINKQSEQAGFCIRQAEQYFTASAQVGLPTRPVLLYYGALSLSQALILVKKDGNYSLDARRKDKRHNHHGLDLHRGVAEAAARAAGPQSFLENIECCVHFHDHQPWGTFPLFYRSLAPAATTINTDIRVAGKNSILTEQVPLSSADLLPLTSIANHSLNAWELFKGLPDLYWSLLELQVTPNLCRGKLMRQVTRTPPDRVQCQDTFFVDGITSDQKESLLESYRRRIPMIKTVDDHGTNLHLSLIVEGPDEDSLVRQMPYYPDIAEDLAGRKYYIMNPDRYVAEPAAILALLFCFSMLCRYYPDVWVRHIDRHVRVAELMNVFLNTAYRRFPNLMLDQLTLTKHSIHP